MNSGGLENYLLRYLSYDTSNEFVILCKSGIGGVLEEKFKKFGHVKAIEKKHIGYFNLVEFLWLYRFIKDNKFDVVCDFTGNFAGVPILCAKIANVSKKITFYRNSANHFKDTWYNRLYDSFVKKLAYKYSDRVLSNSQAAFDYYFPNVVSPKFKVIYNGIDTSKLSKLEKNEMRAKLGIPLNSFVIGHTARLDAAKNHDTIFKVANNVCSNHDNVYFICVGKGVKGYADKLTLHQHIIVHDFRNDILDVLKAFDMYYFPSLWEGQPNALIEALINDLPFVASNIPSIEEAVPENLRCRLVPPLDVNKHVSEIEKNIESTTYREVSICGEWARQYFKAEIRFQEFKNEL